MYSTLTVLLTSGEIGLDIYKLRLWSLVSCNILEYIILGARSINYEHNAGIIRCLG